MFVINTVYQVIILFCILVGIILKIWHTCTIIRTFSIPFSSLRICCNVVFLHRNLTISCKVTLSMSSDLIGFVKTRAQVYLTRRSSRQNYVICLNWNPKQNFQGYIFSQESNIQNKHNRLKLVQVDWIPGYFYKGNGLLLFKKCTSSKCPS